MVEDGAVARFISLKVGTNENGWIGLWKVAKAQNIFRIVVIGVTL